MTNAFLLTRLPLLAATFLFVVAPLFAFAQIGSDINAKVPAGGTTAFPVSAPPAGGTTAYPSSPSGYKTIENPLGSTVNLCGLLKKLFEGAIPLVIPVAAIFIMWSGFKFVLAQGSESKLRDAKQTFYYTIVGIALFLGAWIFAMVIAATINAIGGSNIISCN